ncbi:MAG: hypothetical protein ACK2T6_00385, partial [Anaerolineae bacterium]
IEEMLERTDTEWGPWTIVESTCKRWSRAKVLQTINDRLEGALLARGFDLPPERMLLPERDGRTSASGVAARGDLGDYLPPGHDAPEGAP